MVFTVVIVQVLFLTATESQNCFWTEFRTHKQDNSMMLLKSIFHQNSTNKTTNLPKLKASRLWKELLSWKVQSRFQTTHLYPYWTERGDQLWQLPDKQDSQKLKGQEMSICQLFQSDFQSECPQHLMAIRLHKSWRKFCKPTRHTTQRCNYAMWEQL